jgi:hypothetical protein
LLEKLGPIAWPVDCGSEDVQLTRSSATLDGLLENREDRGVREPGRTVELSERNGLPGVVPGPDSRGLN